MRFNIFTSWLALVFISSSCCVLGHLFLLIQDMKNDWYPEPVAMKYTEKIPNLSGLEFVSVEGEKEIWVTAYNSEVGQCDSDPFISASGRRVYDGMVAMNGVPFGQCEQSGLLTLAKK